MRRSTFPSKKRPSSDLASSVLGRNSACALTRSNGKHNIILQKRNQAKKQEAARQATKDSTRGWEEQVPASHGLCEEIVARRLVPDQDHVVVSPQGGQYLNPETRHGRNAGKRLSDEREKPAGGRVCAEVQAGLDRLQEALKAGTDKLRRDEGRIDAGDGDAPGEDAQKAAPNRRPVQELPDLQRKKKSMSQNEPQVTLEGEGMRWHFERVARAAVWRVDEIAHGADDVEVQDDAIFSRCECLDPLRQVW